MHYACAMAGSYIICLHDFNQDHALSCPTGGLPTIRHNKIRDILATAMSEVCADVIKEPALQHYLEKPFNEALPPTIRMLVWTSEHEASGVADLTAHYLMLGSLILSRSQIVLLPSPQYTSDMNGQNEIPMRNPSAKLSEPPSRC